MEILGLVWAASIINSSSVASSVAKIDERDALQQPFASSQGIGTGLTTLTQVYGWDTFYLDPSAAFSSYASTASLLTPSFSQMALLPETTSREAVVEFSPLTPVLGNALSSLNPPIEDTLQISDSAFLAEVDQWHSWNAVAAVRVVEPHPSEPENTSTAIPSHCLPDSSVTYQASPVAMTSSPKFQVWVKNHFIGEVSGRTAAQRLARRLRALVQANELEPTNLKPLFGSNFVGGSMQSDILFVVDETMKPHPEVPAAAIAVQWINNLRIAFDTSPLELSQIQMAMEGLVETSETFYGTASWYGPGFHGRKTANGERFNENALTAAHKTLPFNTYLKVTNRWNGKSVVVRINDRGPYIGKRTLDLSKVAAQCLGSIGKGVVPYEAVILDSVPKPDLNELTTAQSIDNE